MSVDYKDLFEYRDGNLYWKFSPSPINKVKVGDKAGCLSKGYVKIQYDYKSLKAHRIIWEMFNGKIPTGLTIDHINNNREDNRIENLQLLTNKQNIQRKCNSKGYTKRVRSYKLTRPYEATKKHNDINHYLGSFGTACGAYMANRMFFIRRSYV